MTTELNQSQLIVGTLFKLETVENVTFRFQNFFKDNGGIFIYGLEEYSYLPIDYNPPEKNINLDNFENNITIPAIPLVINLLDAYDYFLDAVVDIKIMLQGFPTTPLIASDRCVISSYSIQDSQEGSGGVSLVIQAPDNAVNSSFPNTFYFTGFSNQGLNLTGYIPNVPISNNVGLQ
jgi:hypothetical protein